MHSNWILTYFCAWIVSSLGYFVEDLGEELGEDELRRLKDIYIPDESRELLIKYEEDWPSAAVLRHLGRITAAVPTDPHGLRVLVLHRDTEDWNFQTFDENHVFRNQSKSPIHNGILADVKGAELIGMYLKDRFYLPHGLTVDPNGSVWITDVALHQVFKFGPDLTEEPLLVLGKKFQPGNDSTHFCKPTHVAVATNGDFFVSDGYCNSRIMKFDPKGGLIKQWGQPTKDPSNPDLYELNVPHQLVLIEEDDLLCVADRENNRIVCYRAGLTPETHPDTGKFVFQIHRELARTGPVYGISFCPYARTIFILVGPGHVEDTVDVQVYSLDSNQFLGSVSDLEQGYGQAHSIAACNSTNGSGCLIVSSLNKPDPIGSDLDSRRLWFYRMLSTRRD